MPMQVFFEYQAPSDARTGSRRIPDGMQEIELFLTGFGTFEIDVGRCALGPGEFIRFAGGESIVVHADREAPYSCCVFHLPESDRYTFPRRTGRLASVDYALALAGEGRMLAARNAITAADCDGWLGIFYHAQRLECLREAEEGYPRSVRTALQYIRGHFCQALRIERVAAAAGVSAPHLFELFRQCVGISPMRLVNNLRLEAAARELSGGSAAVKEIAAACGFADPIRFGTAFKVRYDYTPGRYRRLFSAQASPREAGPQDGTDNVR